MDSEKFSSTAGSELQPNDYIEASPQTGKNTEVSDETKQGNGWSDVFANAPKILGHLEEHFPFTASLVVVIGYVVIAAAGSMENLGQYLGYLLFCALTFLYYLISTRQKIDVEGNKRSKLIVVVALILLTIVLVQNKEVIVGILQKVVK